MALEEYEKARKLGLKEYRGDSVKGRYPYVQVLDEILSFTDIVAEQDIGLLYIPIDHWDKDKRKNKCFFKKLLSIVR